MIGALVVIHFPILSSSLWLKWDVYDAAFPLSVSESVFIKNGALPLWEPFLYRGVPLSHLMGVSVWSPLTIILSVIGYSQYLMQVQYIILVLLAAISMYTALKLYTNNLWLCMAGGVAYATCGQFVGNAQHLTFLLPMAVFPLLHFAFQKWMLNQNVNWSLLMGVILSVLLSNNYPPFAFVSVVFILIEYLLNIKSLFSNGNKLSIFISHLKHAVIIFVVTLLLSAVTIFTSLEVMKLITRQDLTWELATGSSLNVWAYLGSISPGLVQLIDSTRQDIHISFSNVYIAIPIIIAAILVVPKRKKEILLIIIVSIAILVSMGNNGLIYRFFYEVIPSMSSFKFPSGFRYFYFYYINLLAIYNIDLLIASHKLNNLKRGYRTFSYVFLIIGMICIINTLTGVNMSSVPRYFITEMLLSALILLLVILFMSKRRFAVGALCISIILFSYMGVLRNENYTIGTKERPYSYQEQIQNLYDTEMPIEINNQFIKGYPNVMGFTIFTREFQTGGYIGSFELENFSEPLKNGTVAREGSPVIWWTNEAIVDDKDEFVSDYINNSYYKWSPKKITYAPNTLSADIDREESGYLVLEQTFFNGWQVKVNDEKASLIELANGSMAVEVQSGASRVSFEFKPTGVIISAWITFSSWVLLMLYGAFLLLKRTKYWRRKVD